MATAIEWTDETWNPATGCDRVSPGCDHCYAERIAKRFGGPHGFDVKLHPDRLEQPTRWRKPRRVFVNSMSDLFHPDIPDEFIGHVFDVMARADQHTFQVLTKRPQRMAQLLAPDTQRGPEWRRYDWMLNGPGALPNVWLGVSVENQRYADLRIPHLLATPAAVHFLSCEPLLEPIDLSRWLGLEWSEVCEAWIPEMIAAVRAVHGIRDPRPGWVIVGGESGPGARQIEADWVRTLRDQCTHDDVRVPFFFKQWGGRTPKANGRDLDGRTWDEYP